MPIHPFFGISLPIARIERVQGVLRYIVVEHPQDGLLRLPIEWTDQSIMPIPPKVQEVELKASAHELLKLSRACSAATLHHSLDFFHSKQQLEVISPTSKSCHNREKTRVKTATHKRPTTKSRQSMGKSHSQDDLQPKKGVSK